MKGSVTTRLPCPPNVGSGVQQAAAPLRDPSLDPEKAKVSPGEIEAKLRQATGLNRTEPVVRNPRRDRDIANTAGAARQCVARTKCVPSNCVLTTVEDIRRQSWKRRHQHVLEFSIQQPDLGQTENRGWICGELSLELCARSLLQSHRL